MPTPESTLEALASRVAKLEAQNRRLKKMGIASLVAAAAIELIDFLEHKMSMSHVYQPLAPLG